MTIDQAKIFLEMGDNVVLTIEFSKPITISSGEVISNNIHILLKADDFDEETTGDRIEYLVRGHEWSLNKDTGVGLELLR